MEIAMGIDIQNIFDRNAFSKVNVRRTIASDDPSFPNPPKPNTEHYAPSLKHSPQSFGAEIESVPLSAIDDQEKEDLAGKARKSLEEALLHSDKDVVIKNALEAILETYEGKIEDYKTEHPIPGEFPKPLSDPSWSKLAQQLYLRIKNNPLSISRVGSAPENGCNLILDDLKTKIKAYAAGMSIEDMKETDKVIDRIFSHPKNGALYCN